MAYFTGQEDDGEEGSVLPIMQMQWWGKLGLCCYLPMPAPWLWEEQTPTSQVMCLQARIKMRKQTSVLEVALLQWQLSGASGHCWAWGQILGVSLTVLVQSGIVEREEAWKHEGTLRINFWICFLGQNGIFDKILDLHATQWFAGEKNCCSQRFKVNDLLNFHTQYGNKQQNTFPSELRPKSLAMECARTFFLRKTKSVCSKSYVFSNHTQ